MVAKKAAENRPQSIKQRYREIKDDEDKNKKPQRVVKHQNFQVRSNSQVDHQKGEKVNIGEFLDKLNQSQGLELVDLHTEEYQNVKKPLLRTR